MAQSAYMTALGIENGNSVAAVALDTVHGPLLIGSRFRAADRSRPSDRLHGHAVKHDQLHKRSVNSGANDNRSRGESRCDPRLRQASGRRRGTTARNRSGRVGHAVRRTTGRLFGSGVRWRLDQGPSGLIPTFGARA
jgi:hypothetical protein